MNKPETNYELVVLGKTYDHSVEKEFISKTKLGFDITVVYKDGKKAIRHNCHEFHNLWEKDRIACESDYHQSGWVPWDLYNFTKIEVVIAVEYNKESQTLIGFE